MVLILGAGFRKEFQKGGAVSAKVHAGNGLGIVKGQREGWGGLGHSERDSGSRKTRNGW